VNERIKEAIESDPIARAIIATKEAVISVPPGLVPTFAQLVHDYAEQHGESPDACCRAVEIAILQRGIAAMREGLKK